MKRFRIHPGAIAEVDDAAAYYKQKAEGLEQRFLDEFEDALTQIRRRPMMYRIVANAIHKCRLRHFPYGLIYRLQNDVVEVVAVMHLRKDPEYWEARTVE